MKKIILSILTLALAASACVPAAAADTNHGTAPSKTDVNAVCMAGGESPDTVAVDITWDNMSFHYTEGKKTWNPITHETVQESGTWSNTPKWIALVNHSNVDVNASFTFQREGNVNGVFTNDTLSMESGKNYSTASDAPEYLTFLSIIGGSITESGKVGTVTVSVSVPKAAEAGTEDELYAALSSSASTGTQIRLTNDIVLSKKLSLTSSTKTGAVIDLNGKTVSCADDTAVFANHCKVTFKNGTIMSAGSNKVTLFADAGSVITLENCTVRSAAKYQAVFINSGTVSLRDCTVDCGDSAYTPIILQTTDIYDTDAFLTVGGTTTVYSKLSQKVSKDTASTVKFEAGVYNFDPASYVDANAYTVTQDTENGTWTVTSK